MIIRNRYKVPKSFWSNWSRTARHVFNTTYSVMYNDQSIFKHPKDSKTPQEYWKTVAWNAAIIAACSVNTDL